MDTFNTGYVLIVFIFLVVVLSVSHTIDPNNSANDKEMTLVPYLNYQEGYSKN